MTCVSSSLMLLHCLRCHWWCGLWAISGNAPEWLGWHHLTTHTHKHAHLSAAGCLRNRLLIICHRSEKVCSRKINNGWWVLNPVCPPVHNYRSTYWCRWGGKEVLWVNRKKPHYSVYILFSSIITGSSHFGYLSELWVFQMLSVLLPLFNPQHGLVRLKPGRLQQLQLCASLVSFRAQKTARGTLLLKLADTLILKWPQEANLHPKHFGCFHRKSAQNWPLPPNTHIHTHTTTPSRKPKQGIYLNFGSMVPTKEAVFFVPCEHRGEVLLKDPELWPLCADGRWKKVHRWETCWGGDVAQRLPGNSSFRQEVCDDQ